MLSEQTNRQSWMDCIVFSVYFLLVYVRDVPGHEEIDVRARDVNHIAFGVAVPVIEQRVVFVVVSVVEITCFEKALGATPISLQSIS